MKLNLYEPKFEDLWFRHQLLKDEETMSYNKKWGGIIDWCEEEWPDWYDWWIINPQGKRFYRYLQNEEGQFVGEVALHYSNSYDGFIVDIIIHSSFRRKGYGATGLDLLIEKAKEMGLKYIFDDIALDNPAITLFLKKGF